MFICFMVIINYQAYRKFVNSIQISQTCQQTNQVACGNTYRESSKTKQVKSKERFLQLGVSSCESRTYITLYVPIPCCKKCKEKFKHRILIKKTFAEIQQCCTINYTCPQFCFMQASYVEAISLHMLKTCIYPSYHLLQLVLCPKCYLLLKNHFNRAIISYFSSCTILHQILCLYF